MTDTGDEIARLSDDELLSMRQDIEARFQSLSLASQRMKSWLTAVHDEMAARGIDGVVHKITDHAVVRYLQRVKGMDIDAIRGELRELLDESVPARNRDHRWHHSGVILCMSESGKTVVTVISLDNLAQNDSEGATVLKSKLQEALKEIAV